MNRPQALRLRTRVARPPKATVVPEAVEAQPAPAPIGGRRARGAERSQAKRTGYDDLTTEQVIAHISRLSPPELDVLAVHEREHQNRADVLARIALFQGTAPES